MIFIVSLSGCNKMKTPQLNLAEQSGCEAGLCHISAGMLMLYPPASGKHAQHLGSRNNISCGDCHSAYLDNPLHKNGVINGYSWLLGQPQPGEIVYFDPIRNPGASWDDASGSCRSMSCHGDADWHSSAEPACTICHVPGSYLDPMTTNGSGASGKHVKHVSERGFPCTRCHYGYKAMATHDNGVMDTADPAAAITLFDASNPSGVWSGDTGPGTGSCSGLACHGASTLDWYGSGSWALPACPDCHKSTVGTRRQVFDSNGDGSGTGGDFQKESHHVINYASRTTQIVQNADCEVCHDMGNHMSGSIRLKDKDNASNVIVYNPSAPNSLEPFCLSCHDSDGASGDMSPFTSTNILGTIPNRAGTDIKGYWNKTYGHGKRGITCMGNGYTGCHGNYNSVSLTGSINAHGSDNKGLLANKMEFNSTSTSLDASYYELCLDCHANPEYPNLLTIEELTGVAEGGNYAQTFNIMGNPTYTLFPYYVDFMVTGFHDYRCYTGLRQVNLHLYHLATTGFFGTNQWYYRGQTSAKYFPTCSACHNVHGTDTPNYFIWDEWGFSIQTISGVEYGKFTSYSWAVGEYPAFCSFQCHTMGDNDGKYPRSPFNEAKAAASNGTGSSGSLDNGDIVTIRFSDSTNGPAINNGNINSVLALSGGHLWGASINAVWSDSGGKSKNVLTITITDTTGSSIAVGDSITFDLTTITDTTTAANPIRGKMTLMENF